MPWRRRRRATRARSRLLSAGRGRLRPRSNAAAASSQRCRTQGLSRTSSARWQRGSPRSRRCSPSAARCDHMRSARRARPARSAPRLRGEREWPEPAGCRGSSRSPLTACAPSLMPLLPTTVVHCCAADFPFRCIKLSGPLRLRSIAARSGERRGRVRGSRRGPATRCSSERSPRRRRRPRP